jgi:flap endonuclease-1
MGVNLAPLVVKKELSLADLRGKKLAVDTHLVLHQFLTTMPTFTDSKGRLTTHLLGLFFRTTHLMSEGIKLAFIFDGINGKPKETPLLTKEIIEGSKTLLQLLGCPVIQAPSEGEAQCAFMTKRGDVWATASQDYDSLMFGALRLIRNLTISKYRKLPKGGRTKIKLELIELKDILQKHKINYNQFVALCMLIGTDWNPKVPKIGPKNALKFAKNKKVEDIFEKLNLPYNWKETFNFIVTMPTTTAYKLKWAKPNKEAILDFLCKERNFKVERVKSALERLK